jgi:hypothetical protein
MRMINSSNKDKRDVCLQSVSRWIYIRPFFHDTFLPRASYTHVKRHASYFSRTSVNPLRFISPILWTSVHLSYDYFFVTLPSIILPSNNDSIIIMCHSHLFLSSILQTCTRRHFLYGRKCVLKNLWTYDIWDGICVEYKRLGSSGM